MNNIANTTISYGKQRPILFGIFAILAVIVLGSAIAFATGITTPHPAHADDDGGYVDPGSLDDGGLPDVVDTTPDNPTDNPSDYVDTSPCDSCDNTTPDVVDTTPTNPTDNPSDYVDTSPCDNCDDTTPDVIDTTPNNPNDNPSDYVDTSPCDDCSTPETPPVDIPPVDIPPVVIPPVVIPPVLTCPPGETGTYPVCVLPPCTQNCTPPPHVCPVGDTGIYPDCTPPQVCPVGDTGTYPNCMPPPCTQNCTPVCPAGDTGTYPNCVPPCTQNCTPVCPVGDTGTYPDCVPPQVCPTGDTGTYPNCLPPPCTQNCGGGGGCVINCGGGGGQISYGGGSSGQIITPIAVATPASYVELSQIPYTGLDLGPIGTVVYWVLLVLWCLAAAYLIIFLLIPFLYRRISGFGQNVSVMLNQPAGTLAMAGAHGAAAHGSSHAAPYHPAPAAHPAPEAHVVHSSTTTTTKTNNPSAYSAAQGFRSFAQGQELTIDDIVMGLARLPENAPAHEEAAPASYASYPEAQVEAPASYHTAQEVIAAQTATQHQPTHYTAPARAEAPAAAISTDVRDFCGALLNGDRDTVFGTIRQIVREGGDAETFITQVVCALDDAYRNRVDGTKVNPEIARLTQNCATPFLERLTVALTNAVDSSYSPGISGSKLALTRALAVVEG